MRKIYFQDRVIYFKQLDNYCTSKNVVNDSLDMRKYYSRFFEASDDKVLDIYCLDLEKAWNQLCDDFYVFEAAGGCVKDEDNDLLCIFRNGKWDLPKGKMEDGELPAETAIREVEEETGLANLYIIKALEPTYHIYKLNSKDVIKKTYWFLMRTNKNQPCCPQQEEGITEVRWVKPNDINEMTDNTYASLVDLFLFFADCSNAHSDDASL